MTAAVEILKQTPMFATLEEDEVRTLLSLIEVHQFPAGQRIFSRGDVGDCLYIVQEGNVEVFAESTEGHKIVFAEYPPGGVLGEVSLLDGGPRTAAAVTTEDSVLLKFDRADVIGLVTKHPDAALDLLSDMGRKLRATNELLRNPVVRNANEEVAESFTFGERVADKVASFGGSWTFVLLFTSGLVVWMAINTWLAREAFDPFPFILLNLALSTVAALQAPVIMMSQNRQSTKDRIRADLDYEINMKAELEIAHLHHKVDRLHEALAKHLAQPAGNS